MQICRLNIAEDVQNKIRTDAVSQLYNDVMQLVVGKIVLI